MTVQHGDDDLFKQEFDQRRFAKSGKKLDKTPPKKSARRPPVEIILIVAAVIALIVFIWPRSEKKYIAKRAREVLDSLKSTVAVTNLPRYMDDVVGVESQVSGFKYHDKDDKEVFCKPIMGIVAQYGGIETNLIGDLNVTWDKNSPKDAQVEGIVDARGAGGELGEGVYRVKFRFTMRKDDEQGWLVTDIYVIPSQ